MWFCNWNPSELQDNCNCNEPLHLELNISESHEVGSQNETDKYLKTKDTINYQDCSHNCNRLYHYGETKLQEGLQSIPVKPGNRSSIFQLFL